MNKNINKREIKMVATTIKNANAQQLTCFVTFIAACTLSFVFMLIACIAPAIVNVTKATCWASMALEAMSIGFGYIACWIKRNAL